MPAPAIERSFSLSPIQAGMLFNSVYSPSSGVDLLLGHVELEEDLDFDSFLRSWQRVTDAHDVLRTSLRWKDLDVPMQDVHREVAIPIRHQDWSTHDTEEQERRWTRLMREDRAAGFDLARAPLWRVTVVRLGPARHRVLWNIHHALIDTGAMTTVLRQVFGTYDALRAGGAVDDYPIEPAPQQGDYSEWFEQQDVDVAEAYWRERLAGLSGPTRPGFDRGAPPDESTHGVHDVELLRLPAELTSTLARWAKESGLTLNALVQATWAVLASRYSGESRIVFGAVKACRRSCIEGADRMVGIVLNTLPFTIDVDPDEDALAFLGRVRETWVALREHEHTPLVRMKEWSEYVGRPPLFESLVCFDAMEYADWMRKLEPSWDARKIDIWGQPDMPLALNAYGGERLLFRICYDPRRFEAGVVRRMLGHMQTFLENLVRTPEGALGDVSHLTDDERANLVGAASVRDAAEGGTLHELVEEQTRRTPDALAVLDAAGAGLTYRELEDSSHRLANVLREHGVGPGVAVGVAVERSLATPLAVLAVLKAGGAYVPLDPSYPAARLGAMLTKASVPLVIVHDATRSRLKQLVTEAGRPAPAFLCLDGDADRIAAAPAELEPAATSTEDLAYVLFTSGSTGKPKGVAMPHGPLVNLVRWQLEQSGAGVGTRTLQFAPIGFDVSCQEIAATLASGGTLVLLDEETRRNPDALLAHLCQREVERVFLPFVALEGLVQVAAERDRYPTALREVITAGEALRVDAGLVRFFERLPNCSLVNQYGPTECHVVTAWRLSGPPSEWPALPPIGRPIANTRAYVLDSRMQPVSDGVPGELYIGGVPLARGYIGEDELTRERFFDDPFGAPGDRVYRTGDLVRRNEDGALEFLGRADDQVKLRGFRVELGEVEAVLVEHDAVTQAAFVVREDAPGDQRLVGYYVARAGSTVQPAALREHLRTRLPAYMIPSALVTMDALPLTPSGKLERRALPAPQDRQSVDAFVEPSGETELEMARIWSEILHVDRVGARDDFFDLGGHSLLGMRVVNRLRDAFGVEPPLDELFTDPVLASMSERVDALVWAHRGSSGPISGEHEEIEL